MLALSDELEKKYLERYVGRNMEVLYEQEMHGHEGYIEGLTNNYIRVMAKGDISLKGKLAQTQLSKVNGVIFEGKLLQKPD